MIKQFCLCIIIGCFTIFLASCSSKEEPTDSPAPPTKDVAQAPPAKADPREIKLFVDGMSEKLNLV